MLAALKFLVGSCQHVFRQYYYKTAFLSKKCYFKFNLRINDLHHQKGHKKLTIRHLNGHLDFSSGFQVIVLKITKKFKNARIAQKPWALV